MDKESEGEKGRAERERQGDRETEGERERDRNGTGCVSLLVVWGNKGDVVDAAQRPALLRPPRLLTEPFPVFDLKSLFRTTLLLSSPPHL